MKAHPDDSHPDLIRETMQEKDTEELIAIWRTKDRSEWTEAAYQIVEAILIQRLGGLPEPVETGETGELEEEDTYHDPEELDVICNRANSLATLAMVLAYVFIGLAIVVFVITILITSSSSIGNALLFALPATLSVLFLALLCSVLNVMLKTFEEGLYLLLDIELNTRISHPRF